MKAYRAALVLVLWGIALAAVAQAFPARPVTIVVPFSAGGPTDTIARIILGAGSAVDISEQAAKEGVWDLRRAGLEKVKVGLTSLEEVNSVTIE